MRNALARQLSAIVIWGGCATAWLTTIAASGVEARERWQELAAERGTVEGRVVSRPNRATELPRVFALTQVSSLQKGEEVVVNPRRVSRAELQRLEAQGTSVSLAGTFIAHDKWEKKPVLWADFINPTPNDFRQYNKAVKAHDACLEYWSENCSADGGSLGQVNMAFSRIVRTMGVADRAMEKAVAAAGDRSSGTIDERSQRAVGAYEQSVNGESDKSFSEAIQILGTDPTLKRAIRAAIGAADTVSQ
jgi:hypothetical protein